MRAVSFFILRRSAILVTTEQELEEVPDQIQSQDRAAYKKRDPQHCWPSNLRSISRRRPGFLLGL
jgi:hypothetical protein